MAAIFPLSPAAAQAAIVSIGGLADLTLAQQALIQEGTFVTTSDGKRWQYDGTGDKTSASNYILISDETPEWAVISGKPSLAFQSFTFAGNGTTTVFSVSGLADNNAANASVAINGVSQEPGSDYQVNASSQTVTMSQPIPVGSKLVITTLNLLPTDTTLSAEQIGALSSTSIIDGGAF